MPSPAPSFRDDSGIRLDYFGNRAISVMGDSITHGANAPDIPTQSYIGLLKKTINKQYSSDNYGFVSLEFVMGNAHGTYRELHKITHDYGFNVVRSGKYLNCYAMLSANAGSQLQIQVLRPFKEAYVYYDAGPDFGTFTVSVSGNIVLTVDCDAEVQTTRRTDAIDISAHTDAAITVDVISNGQRVVITGMAYYNDSERIVVNNYASNGSKLIDYANAVIDIACQADTLIFSLGYNDSHSGIRKDSFTKKIDAVIEYVNTYGTTLYVVDCIWDQSPDTFFKQELVRLAEACNGVYIDPVAVYGDEMLRHIPDGAHPNVAGNLLIATLLIEAMGLG
jgi:lysophospholipase L1-like esterase